MGIPGQRPGAYFVSYESVVLGDSPSLLWMMLETSGTTTADATGNGYAGTVTGDVTVGQPGPSGVGTYAYALGGTSSQVEHAGHTFSGSSFTHEMWFKTSTGNGGLALSRGDTFAPVWIDSSGYAVLTITGTWLYMGTRLGYAQ